MAAEVSGLGVSARRLAVGVAATAAAVIALTGSALGKGTAPQAIDCQPFTKKPCLMPFPNDLFTKKDRKTETGRRLALPQKAMPKGSNGRIDVGPYDMNDGFDPGTTVIARIPGMDTQAAYDQTKPVPQNNIGKYLAKKAPVVLIDAKTGKRQPIWTELDSTAPNTDATSLLTHPAKLLHEGHRYIIALRHMKSASGKELKAPKWFELLRDGKTLPKRERSQKARYKSIFKSLKKAKIQRKSLYEAWDFTVASRKSLTTTMLSIRDDAFKDLGDTNLGDGVVSGSAPAFAVTNVVTTGLPTGIARDVEGTFTAPCYLDSANCALGGRFSYSGGTYPHPLQNGTTTVHFRCAIPTSADTTPARGMVYGHGLFGSDTQAVDNGGGEGVLPLDTTYNFVSCGTEFWGLAGDSSGAPGTESDEGYDAGVLTDLSQFPTIGDRFQQAYINQLLLGRLMRSPDGFVDDDNFQNPSNQPVIDTSQLYYYGNSQGGIQGGGYTALSPDISRSVLGVPGLDYGGLLLQRSSDFVGVFDGVINSSYTDTSQYTLILDLIEQLWDKGEAEGYAQHMTSKPLPNTPSHKVLMHVAYGDHQVSMYAAMVEARTIGAKIYAPNGEPLDPARLSHDANLDYGIAPMPSFPFDGSGVVIWDDGPGAVPPPPYGNVPPTTGPDPHGHPRKTAAAQQQIATFLNNATGTIIDTCGNAPCHTDFFVP